MRKLITLFSSVTPYINWDEDVRKKDVVVFNKDSVHYRLYKFVYGEDLPLTVSSYFWKVLLAAIVFIPLWMWKNK